MQDREFAELHGASIRVLTEAGFHVPDDGVLARCAEAGLAVDAARRCVRFREGEIADAVARAPKEVRLWNHAGGGHVPLGRGTYFMPSGTGVAVFDAKTGERRPSGAADVRDLIRLQDALENVHVARPMVTALESGPQSDLVECYLSLLHTGKPFLHRTLSDGATESLLRMGEAASGGAAGLRERPPFGVVYCPKSPLSITPEAMRSMLAFAGAGVPVLVLSMAMGGATAPVTLRGLVVLVNAELLAGITIIETLCPGAPVFYGSVASVLDMKTAVLALGAPERGIVNALLSDMAARYGIPSIMGGLSTDAKEPDAQAGFEKTATLLPLIGRASLVFGMGVMDSANTYSAEELVLDDEMVGAALRMHRGVEGGSLDEDIALIKEIGWSGEYLTSRQTLRRFRENFQPRVFTREAFEKWLASGRNLRARARERVAALLAEPPRTYLDPALDAELRGIMAGHGLALPENP